MTINLGTAVTGGFLTPIVLTASGNPSGTSVSFAPNPLTPGNSTDITLNGTNLLKNGSYIITVTGTAGAIVQTRDITYTINAGTPPSLTTDPASQTLCEGSEVTFNVAATGALTYQWQLSTNSGVSFNNISGATGSAFLIPNITASQNNYQYRCVVTGQCNFATSAAATLTVRQLPTVGLSASPLTSLQPGQTTTLTATPSNSTGGLLTTTWFYNTSPITNPGNTRLVDVENIGVYQVRIQEVWPSTLTCASLSPVVSIVAPASSRLFIFPSPNNGTFTVSYYNAGGASLKRSIFIYDSKGDRVFNKAFNVSGLYTLLNIDIRPAQAGVYYVVLGDDNGKKIITGKLLVQ